MPGLPATSAAAYVALAAIAVLAACTVPREPDPIAAEEVISELEGRSFRQFDPSLDRSPRKAVVLDFSDGMSLWAQNAEGDSAVHEWEIYSEHVSVQVEGGVATLSMVAPGSRREFPSRCENCIRTGGVSVSVRNVASREEIEFRLNDPHGVLPSPFPVFDTWTRFREDEPMDR